MKKLVYVMAFVMSTVLAGCSGLTEFISKDPDTAALSAQVAALKYIERKEGLEARSYEAAEVRRFAQDGLEALAKEDSVLISEFSNLLSQSIQTDELSDRALAELLISRISERLNEWADRQGLLGEDRKVAVGIVLKAVLDAADMYILQ